MIWIDFLLRRRSDSEERTETPGQQAASSALHRAQHARRQAEQQRGAVSETARRLRQVRERNHFAEMIRTALEGDR